MIGQDIIARFAALLGPKGVVTDPDDIAPWTSDWRGRYHGAAAAILAPASTQEVAATVALAAELGVALVPQGGEYIDGRWRYAARRWIGADPVLATDECDPQPVGRR